MHVKWLKDAKEHANFVKDVNGMFYQTNLKNC